MLNSFFIRLVRFLLGLFVKPLITLAYKVYYRHLDKSRPLPKIKHPLLLLPANQIAKKIRNREVTSQEVVQLFVDRIKQVQPLLNCVVKTCFEEALEEAKRVDSILDSAKMLEKYSEKNAPLLGVPFSCKECISVAGMPNSTGLVCRKEVRADRDADVVANMRRSGAILTCLTNTSELCMWMESSNHLYGTTRNPYNLSRIVGGSSGGEGCLVASAGSVLGVGSDIGGSIRMPAFFNGVYGHKPSSHLVSNQEQYPPASGIRNDMLVTGPICRYASDLSLALRIFAGSNFDEIADKFEAPTDLKKLKYYFIRDLQGNVLTSDLSFDTREAFERSIKFLERDLNVEVKELHLPKLKSIFQIWVAGMSHEQDPKSFTKLMGDGQHKVNLFLELIKTLTGVKATHTLPALFLGFVEYLPKEKPLRHIQMGEKLKQELKIILGDDGVLLFPSFPVSAMYHNQPLLTNSFDWIYYGMFNVLGFPVTQCPMGLNKDGLPTGVQIVANHKCDHLTIKIAEHMEKNLTGWTQPS